MPSCLLKKWPFLLSLKSELLVVSFQQWHLSAFLSENVTEHHSCVLVHRTKLLCPCIVHSCVHCNRQQKRGFAVRGTSPHYPREWLKGPGPC